MLPAPRTTVDRPHIREDSLTEINFKIEKSEDLSKVVVSDSHAEINGPWQHDNSQHKHVRTSKYRGHAVHVHEISPKRYSFTITHDNKPNGYAVAALHVTHGHEGGDRDPYISFRATEDGYDGQGLNTALSEFAVKQYGKLKSDNRVSPATEHIWRNKLPQHSNIKVEHAETVSGNHPASGTGRFDDQHLATWLKNKRIKKSEDLEKAKRVGRWTEENLKHAISKSPAWSPDDIANHLDRDHTGTGAGPEGHDWSYELVPIHKFVSDHAGFKTPTSWSNWYQGEKATGELSGDQERTYKQVERDYLREPHEHPVIAEIKGGKYNLDDGHHRVGIAHSNGMTHVPALVGRPKAKMAKAVVTTSRWGQPVDRKDFGSVAISPSDGTVMVQALSGPHKKTAGDGSDSSWYYFDRDQKTGKYGGKHISPDSSKTAHDIFHTVVKPHLDTLPQHAGKPAEYDGITNPGAYIVGGKPNPRIEGNPYVKQPAPAGNVLPLKKGARGDWQKEGYKFHYSLGTDEGGDPQHTVVVTHPSSQEPIGRFTFGSDSMGLEAQNAFVHKDHRRKGIATQAYQTVADKTGTRVMPSFEMSPDAQAFWDVQSNKGIQPIKKGMRGDWKKEGYRLEHDQGTTIHRVIAYHGDKEVGTYHFQASSKYPGYANVMSSDTHPDHQRKGLASAAYGLAEKKMKLRVRGSPGTQSQDAQALWNQPNRPFGKSDKIPGGLADNKRPSDFDPEQLAAGIKVELEHTSDPKIALEIAMDHLTEDPNYYIKLKTIEKSDASGDTHWQVWIGNSPTAVNATKTVDLGPTKGTGYVLEDGRVISATDCRKVLMISDVNRIGPNSNTADTKGVPLKKGAAGDWQKEGYRLEHQKLRRDRSLAWDEETHVVNAYPPGESRPGYIAGQAEFIVNHSDKTIEPTVVHTHAEHTRKGLMSGSYALMEQKTGYKMKPSGDQSADAKKFWSQPNRPFGKSLAYHLQKGSAQRRMPFDPNRDVPEQAREKVESWTLGDGNYDRHQLPRLEGPARQRALLKLHSQTESRRNPTTGEREFLLHRGQTMRDINEGGLHGLSSFTPDPRRAIMFNDEAVSAIKHDPESFLPHGHPLIARKKAGTTTDKDFENEFGKIYSAWVPESQIHHIPNAWGSKIYENPNRFKAGHGEDGPTGKQYRHPEQEIIVHSGKLDLKQTPSRSPDSHALIGRHERHRQSMTKPVAIVKKPAAEPGKLPKLIGKSEVAKVLLQKSDKSLIQVATVAVIDRETGRILMGRRQDNDLWTQPGGHVERGETPIAGAIRELWEEAGIRATTLKYLGTEDVVCGDGKKRTIHCFAYFGRPKTTSANDPDKEVRQWVWVPAANGLPKEVMGNLHSRKNVLLKLLGLQRW